MKWLDVVAPFTYQESYDNAGLLYGDKNWPIKGVLVSLDVTPAVVDEAIEKKCNVIVAHHPVIFKGIKRVDLTRTDHQVVVECIRNDIALIATHTNLDSVFPGVSSWLANQIGLEHVAVLQPRANTLVKLVTYVPENDIERVRNALFAAGAGHIGNYDHCSFVWDGTGTFRGNELSDPKLGTKGVLEVVNEKAIEVILPVHLKRHVLEALTQAHPYEEVAYGFYAILNEQQNIGFGAIGLLPEPMHHDQFLNHLASRLTLKVIRATKKLDNPIHKVALCGGSGAFLIEHAMACGADAYVTGDLKYHDFFEAGNMMLADIGHYESEIGTSTRLAELINKKFPNFATLISEVRTSPIYHHIF